MSEVDKTILDFSEITDTQDTDVVYVVRGTGTDRDKHQKKSNLLQEEKARLTALESDTVYKTELAQEVFTNKLGYTSKYIKQPNKITKKTPTTPTPVGASGIIIEKLSSTDIAVYDVGTDVLQVYRRSGTTFSTLGSPFTITTTSYPGRMSLLKNDGIDVYIAYIDSNTYTLQTYKFSYTTLSWSTIGSSISLPSTSNIYIYMTALTDSLVCVSAPTTGTLLELITYEFTYGTSSWGEVGTRATINSATGNTTGPLCALQSSFIATTYFDGTSSEFLDIYYFDPVALVYSLVSSTDISTLVSFGNEIYLTMLALNTHRLALLDNISTVSSTICIFELDDSYDTAISTGVKLLTNPINHRSYITNLSDFEIVEANTDSAEFTLYEIELSSYPPGPAFGNTP